MSERDDFLEWVRTGLYDAEVALHNGDATPRLAVWSANEPVTVLGAWRTATNYREARALHRVGGDLLRLYVVLV